MVVARKAKLHIVERWENRVMPFIRPAVIALISTLLTLIVIHKMKHGRYGGAASAFVRLRSSSWPARSARCALSGWSWLYGTTSRSPRRDAERALSMAAASASELQSPGLRAPATAAAAMESHAAATPSSAATARPIASALAAYLPSPSSASISVAARAPV